MTEQELMLTAVRKCRRIDLYVNPKLLDPYQEKQFHEMCHRRKSGEPLQYILGECEFLNVTLHLNSSVLIPRPETEILAQSIIERCSAQSVRLIHILDIGSGSGNIALSLAKNILTAHVTGVDISKEAIDLARKNAYANDLSERVTFLESDLFNAFNNAKGTKPIFDVIASNPPYIPTGDLLKLPEDVQREPKEALNGGGDGLSFYRRIIDQSPAYLKSRGLLCFEIGDGQKDRISALFEESNVWSIVDVIKDCCQTERVVIAQFRG